MSAPPADFTAALARERRRVWALCYRMTGERSDADDLAQEALARALERHEQVVSADVTGWLLRLTTRLCIDHFRHQNVVRRVTQLVDPLVGDEWCIPDPAARAPDFAAILREDTRFAMVVALQWLSPRQRAALILHDVCGRSLAELSETLETNANAVKALLHRARVALRDARVRDDVDVPVDRAVVERFAAAIEAGSIEALTALLREDIWGLVDGGGVMPGSTRPTFGVRAVSRQWANGRRRLAGQPVTTTIVVLSGEPAIVVRLAAMPDLVVAIVHLETCAGGVCALRVGRDPDRVARVVAEVSRP
jgi:RNA polymerase sigma-70 factor (ECF subfamily)